MTTDLRRWMTAVSPLTTLTEANEQVANAIMGELSAQGWESPAACNDGYCGDFADNVVRELGRGKVLSTDTVKIKGNPGGRHEWIYVDGLHYDSETPFGVKHPRDLGYFARHSGRPMPPHLWEPDADAESRDDDNDY